MKRLRFSPSSCRDLDEILAFIARDKLGAAAKFVAKLKESCVQLARSPNLGEDCSELCEGMRRFVVRGYSIFYRTGDQEVEILRVIHGARDWASLFS